jgi:hypothetical protein
VNALGGYNIAADRLAFIDGEGMLVLFIAHIYPAMLTAHGSTVDPWRPYTPHNNYGGAMERDDTLLRPFKIIPGAFQVRLLGVLFCSEVYPPGGVHHWDENGLMDGAREPKDIRQIHNETIEFVKSWLKDWEGPRRINFTIQ